MKNEYACLSLHPSIATWCDRAHHFTHSLLFCIWENHSEGNGLDASSCVRESFRALSQNSKARKAPMDAPSTVLWTIIWVGIVHLFRLLWSDCYRHEPHIVGDGRYRPLCSFPFFFSVLLLRLFVRLQPNDSSDIWIIVRALNNVMAFYSIQAVTDCVWNMKRKTNEWWRNRNISLNVLLFALSLACGWWFRVSTCAYVCECRTTDYVIESFRKTEIIININMQVHGQYEPFF